MHAGALRAEAIALGCTVMCQRRPPRMHDPVRLPDAMHATSPSEKKHGKNIMHALMAATNRWTRYLFSYNPILDSGAAAFTGDKLRHVSARRQRDHTHT